MSKTTIFEKNVLLEKMNLFLNCSGSSRARVRPIWAYMGPYGPEKSKKLPQQQTLIAKETKPDGESMKDTRQGVHIQIDVAAKALFGVLL